MKRGQESMRFGAHGWGANPRAAFSLIEILVATTILMVIVLMVSLVFQQSSGAWQGGVRRTDNQMNLRGVLGVMTREMALAVDGRDFPGVDQNFADSEVTFIALAGSPEVPGNRVARQITYRYSNGTIKRTAREIKYAPGSGDWQVTGTPDETILNPGVGNVLTDFRFDVTEDPDDRPGLPLRVEIEAKVQASGTEAIVSGRSAGRDREFDTRDDLQVGGDTQQ